MGNTDWNDEEVNTEETPLVKKLRKQLDEVSKSNKERDAELITLRSKVLRSEIASTLAALGVTKTAISKFIPEGLDPTPENIKGWLKENGELFGIDLEQKPDSETQTKPPADTSVPGLTPEQVAEYVKVQGSAPAAGTVAPSGDDAILAGLKTAFDQTASFNQFWDAANKATSR